jgi:hypothetical protein
VARPTEVKAITALLEAEHPDVESLAKRVIETLDQLRLTRPSYAIRLAWDDDSRFGIGPFENRQRARQHLKTLVPGLEDPDRVIVELKPLGWWLGEVATPARAVCSVCGHPSHTHNWPKYRRKRQGCIVSLTPRGEPGSNLCPCEGDGS